MNAARKLFAAAILVSSAPFAHAQYESYGIPRPTEAELCAEAQRLGRAVSPRCAQLDLIGAMAAREYSAAAPAPVERPHDIKRASAVITPAAVAAVPTTPMGVVALEAMVSPDMRETVESITAHTTAVYTFIKPGMTYARQIVFTNVPCGRDEGWRVWAINRSGEGSISQGCADYMGLPFARQITMNFGHGDEGHIAADDPHYRMTALGKAIQQAAQGLSTADFHALTYQRHDR